MSCSKIASYIGLAQRSGSVLYGEERIAENTKKCLLILVDRNAPEKYKNRLRNLAGDIPCFDTEDLAQTTHRDNVKAIGIVNPNLAEAIINLLR